MNKRIAVIPGDGIGPEIVAEGLKVLRVIGEKYGHNFEFQTVFAGGRAIDETGSPLPQDTINACENSDSVLLGAVGGPKWDHIDKQLRPECGLLALRRALSLYANIRPAFLFDELADACPLRADIAKKGFDFVIVRELTGGLYFGKRETTTDALGKRQAYDTLLYTEQEIERIARAAFSLAMKRRKNLVSVDKFNVLDTSRLWREVMHRIREEYPQVDYSDMLVDSCSMQLIKDPQQFDVIVTENMFGDILSDEASMLTGSIGMIPSMSIGAGTRGLYEPIHGSAPDIAGQDKANPIATILSCALMLRYSFALEDEAKTIESAVKKTLGEGYATGDILRPGKMLLSCSQMGDKICENII